MTKKSKSFLVIIGVLAFAFLGCLEQQGSPADYTTDTTDKETDSQTDSESDSESDTDTETEYLPEAPGKLAAIWGSSSTDIWAGGFDGTLLHGDGTSWELVVTFSNGCIRDIHGSSSDNVYVVGYGNTTDQCTLGAVHFMRFNGNAWTEIQGLISDTVWACSPDDVFTIGNPCLPMEPPPAPYLSHFDGSLWTIESFGNLAGWFEGYFLSLAGAPGGYLFAVGTEIARFDGASWSYDTMGATPLLRDVWAHTHDDAFAVGENSTILHFNGSSWSSMTSPTTVSLFGVWGPDPDDVFAVGQDVVLHYNGIAWSEMSIPTVDNLQLMDVWGSSPNDVYAVGGSGAEDEWGYQEATILHYDGLEWTATVFGGV